MAENFEMDVRIETNMNTIDELLKTGADIKKIVADSKNFKIVTINGLTYKNNFTKDKMFYIDPDKKKLRGLTVAARKLYRFGKQNLPLISRNLDKYGNPIQNGGNRKTHNKKNSLNKSRKNKKSPM